MEIITRKTELTINNEIFPIIDYSESIFFDIETTGFSSKNTKLYLIGCVYYNEADSSFYTKQFFANSFEDEPLILQNFFDFIKDYKNIVHFNGKGFDIPYLEAKCIQYNLNYSFDEYNSIDIYKTASYLKNILKLENSKQKTIEGFLDISREDKYSGKDLINIYIDYVKNQATDSKNFLLLHNYEDILGMISLLYIYNYDQIFHGDILVLDIDISDEAIIECALPYAIPKRISYGDSTFYFTAFSKTLRLKVPIYSGGLKFFYPNYKDYYYLPKEDYSIHKSVAFYVDKNFRTKAKAANCYSKKTGRFLPQINEIISPYFKINYEDKTTYFELEPDIINSKELLTKYVKDVLLYLYKYK